MHAITESGAIYDFAVVERCLMVRKSGSPEAKALALFPDRLPFAEATVKWTRDGEYVCGFNAAGVRTLRVIPTQVRVGMVFWSPQGLRSTQIKAVRH